MIVATFLLAAIGPALEHTQFESIMVSPALEISYSYRVAAIAVGFILMFIVCVVQLLRSYELREILIIGAMIGALLAVLLVAKPYLITLGQANILIFLVMGTGLCLLMGVPIAFCFGVGTLTFIAFASNTPLSIMIGRMDEGMSNLILLSVPVFVLLGCILDATGMGKAIVDFLSSLIGHVRAGMAYVLLGSLYLVSGISGSKVSDMATVAPALFS